ncbi:MAG: hypothetical protein WD139_14230 [Balneolaceae bacterium]
MEKLYSSFSQMPGGIFSHGINVKENPDSCIPEVLDKRQEKPAVLMVSPEYFFREIIKTCNERKEIEIKLLLTSS